MPLRRLRVRCARHSTPARIPSPSKHCTAARRAESALIRAALERSAEQSEAWAVVVLFLVMIAGVTVGFNLHRFGNCHSGMTIHQGSTMRLPVAEEDPPSLWDRRLGYLYRVLTDATVALSYVEDPWVREALEAGAVHTLKVLYLAGAALEHHEHGTLFSDPYDGLWSFFSEQFKARSLRRPARPEEWREFFRPVE